MGVVSLSTEQKAELDAMYGRIGQDIHAIDVWRKLASYGDTYAASALKVIDEPGSMPWSVVRGVWYATGADFSKFDAVADQHAKNYIARIDQRPDVERPGWYRLPSTRDIENSYASALARFGIDRYTAIDLNIEKIKTNSMVNLPPHWYDTPGVMHLEDGRIEPTDPQLLQHMDGDKASHIYWETSQYATAIYANTGQLGKGTVKIEGKINQRFNHSSTLLTQYGISYYYNTQTGNWAYFDEGGHGAAFIDGQEIKISPDNWRKQPNSEEFQIRNTDGTWKTAAVDNGSVFSPDYATQEKSCSDSFDSYTRYTQNDVQADKNNAQQGNPGFSSTGDPELDRLAAAFARDDDVAISQVSAQIARSPSVQAMAQQGRDLLAAQQLEEQQQEALRERQDSPLSR
jgi:hypothetical protein